MKTQSSTRGLASLRSRRAAIPGGLDMFRLIVESAEDYAIFMLDPDGYVRTWNKGAQKIKGYSDQEIIGRHYSVFYLPADRRARKPQRALELARKYGRVEDEDWRVKKDGSTFWANVVITALRDEDGELVGFAEITRNLTERKQHEDNLSRANAALYSQLKDLEVLNASKDEFVSVAAHQLRTPATAIKQLLGLVVDGYIGSLEPHQLEVVQKAYECNERQLSIVRGLLKVAQLDAGKVVLKKISMDVSGLVRNIADEFASTFNERSQRCFLELDPAADCCANVDYDNFRMALENIIDNASKYTPAGGEVRLAVSAVEETVRIAVTDTGVGIAPGYMDRLFERFSRIPNELPNSVPGSGLGLYWANKVVQLHGGAIEVWSAPARGTTFTILLPKETGCA